MTRPASAAAVRGETPPGDTSWGPATAGLGSTASAVEAAPPEAAFAHVALLHAPRSPSLAEAPAPLGREGAHEAACPLLGRPGPRGGVEEGEDMASRKIDEAARPEMNQS